MNNIYNSNQRKDAQRDFRKLNLINSFVFSASTEKPENAKFIAKLNISDEQIVSKIMEKYRLSEEKVKSYLN